MSYAGSSPVAGDIRPVEVVTALTAVINSHVFAAAPRSREFLAYIVSEDLAGRGDRLTEHAVARHALGRPDFDGRLDSSVRVQATRLRTALARYYDAEGSGDTVRISLPVGSYRPAVTRFRPDRFGLSSDDEAVVAVLQFDADGDEASLISATMCDAIAGRLADFPGLRVVGPASVADAEVGAASLALGARFILQGTVTIADASVLLEAALTDAFSGDVVHHASESIQRGAFDAMWLEDRWAAAIAGQIGDSTGVIFRSDLRRQHPDATVYAARLAYTDYVMKGTSESVAAAADALDRALEAGRRADLLAMRGAVHNAQVNQGDALHSREPHLLEAEALAHEALADDPRNAHAYLVLGGAAWQRQQWDPAHSHSAQAARLAPFHPTVLMSAGNVMAMAGDWEGGLLVMRRGFRLNPLHPGYAHAVPAVACLVAGDDAGALAEASMIHAPGQLWGPLYRALALSGLGYVEQARAEMSQVLEIDPSFLDDPAGYFTSSARLGPAQLETLLAHFEPFTADRPG
jgi:TolB-like protein